MYVNYLCITVIMPNNICHKIYVCPTHKIVTILVIISPNAVLCDIIVLASPSPRRTPVNPDCMNFICTWTPPNSEVFAIEC